MIMKKIVQGVCDPRKAFRHLRKKLLIGGAGLIDGYSDWPFLINISVNNICNLKCRMCDVGISQKGTFFYKNLSPDGDKVLDVGQWEMFLDQVAHFSPEIAISTTEPLLYKGLFSLIKKIRARKMRCQVTTNGFLLPQAAAQLVESGLERLNISIDGPAPIHDQIRARPGSFENAVRGIEKIAGIKKELKTACPAVHVFYTISEYNCGYLAETAKIVGGLAVQSLTFQHLGFVDARMASAQNAKFTMYPVTVSTVAGTDPARVDIASLSAGLADIKKASLPISVFFYPDIAVNKLHAYYNDPQPVRDAACRVPWSFAQINCNGDVVPLARCFNIVMGNILHERFSAVWNCRKYRDFRKTLKKEKALPACSKCCALYF